MDIILQFSIIFSELRGRFAKNLDATPMDFFDEIIEASIDKEQFFTVYSLTITTRFYHSVYRRLRTVFPELPISSLKRIINPDELFWAVPVGEETFADDEFTADIDTVVSIEEFNALLAEEGAMENAFDEPDVELTATAPIASTAPAPIAVQRRSKVRPFRIWSLPLKEAFKNIWCEMNPLNVESLQGKNRDGRINVEPVIGYRGIGVNVEAVCDRFVRENPDAPIYADGIPPRLCANAMKAIAIKEGW